VIRFDRVGSVRRSEGSTRASVVPIAARAPAPPLTVPRSPGKASSGPCRFSRTDVTGVTPIPLESAVDTFSFAGERSAFDATVRPVLARIETDAGHVGLGESYLDDPAGERAAFVAQGVCAPRARPRRRPAVRRLFEEMSVHAKRSASYRSPSAIDETLWDLAGKAAGESRYRLLGGRADPVSA